MRLNFEGRIKGISRNNRPCQTKNTLFYPFTLSIIKCGRSFKAIDDPNARVCVPNKVKNMNVKVFHLMLGVKETRYLVRNQSCKCKCRLNKSLCYSKQKWNHDECRCECKELDHWGFCKDDYMWHPSKCDCECNKACDKLDGYLDIKN